MSLRHEVYVDICIHLFFRKNVCNQKNLCRCAMVYHDSFYPWIVSRFIYSDIFSIERGKRNTGSLVRQILFNLFSECMIWCNFFVERRNRPFTVKYGGRVSDGFHRRSGGKYHAG